METLSIKRTGEKQFADKGTEKWPVWEKEFSGFDGKNHHKAQCLSLEGKEIAEISAGNFVIRQDGFVRLTNGLKCIWDIKRPISKHYFFK